MSEGCSALAGLNYRPIQAGPMNGQALTQLRSW